MRANLLQPVKFSPSNCLLFNSNPGLSTPDRERGSSCDILEDIWRWNLREKSNLWIDCVAWLIDKTNQAVKKNKSEWKCMARLIVESKQLIEEPENKEVI